VYIKKSYTSYTKNKKCQIFNSNILKTLKFVYNFKLYKLKKSYTFIKKLYIIAFFNRKIYKFYRIIIYTMKITKRILTNKVTGHMYVVIPSFLNSEIGDYALINNKIKIKIWRMGKSKIVTIPKKHKELKVGDLVEITDIIKKNEKINKAGNNVPEKSHLNINKEVIQYE